ncbi:MAG: endonuclease III [Candidatus Omnitrophica bacterium]|nr:endonuclease III [Candidatus Omnitrophota bacterium]
METLDQRRARTKKIIAILKKAHPDARLALDFSNPLELLVALILAAQARDDVVNSVTSTLFKKYRTASDWAAESPEKLHEQLRRINFYRQKTRSIQKACEALSEKFGEQVPANLDDLLTLPGVGRKTANIILGNAFSQLAIGVDTHVARVSQRVGLTDKSDPDKIEADLMQIVPEKERVVFCHLLQYHGRRVCTAKKPDCPHCTIDPLCFFPDKTPSESG